MSAINGRQTFSVKDQVTNIWGFAGYVNPTATSQLCDYIAWKQP